VHPCAQCGHPVEPLDRFCPACGATQEAASSGAQAALPQRHFRCQSCGAEVALDPDQRSYTCPFCDSNYVVEFTLDQTGRQPPEFIIGFAITPQQAQEAFRQWLRQNSWFRPSDLTIASVAEKLRGVYLPFWSFSMLARSQWSASIGEHWWRTETYTTTENGKTVIKTRQVQETEWWGLAGRHHRYHGGYLVSGSRGLSQDQALRLYPFQLPALRRYVPYFLAGWLSEEYSIQREAALQLCQNEFFAREQRHIGQFLPGDTYSDLQVQTHFEDVNSDLILLPVYLLSYRYRDKVYRFLLNGQTGKSAGDKPLSWRKILLLIAGVIAAIVVVTLLAGSMR